MTKLLYIALFATAGCLGIDDTSAPDEGEVESESVPTQQQGAIGQGSTMQGSTMQGSTMQGSTMQGSTMQGSTMQGGMLGATTAQYGSVRGTALVFWTRNGKIWEERYPDKICYWNSTRTVMTSCTKTGIGAPIVGSTWPTTFRRVEADGTVSNIPVTLRIEAVRKDTTTAMFRLEGSSYATGAIVACENPRNCRVNSDIFNYDVKAIDVVDANGQNPWLCPAGQTAIALSGTWNSSGTYVASTMKGAASFTFACTNGVIAKCTRWGYRHYDQAVKDNGPGYPESLAAYHQTCLRAAMADYCGSAKSMTKDGTLVDIYDYSANYQSGYVPQTRGFVYPTWEYASTFAWEGGFDRYGATRIDHTRYAELATIPEWNIEAACPGTFWDSSSGEYFANWIRNADPVPPYIYVDSTTACSHSEYTVGKYLSPACSYCTAHVPSSCNDPAQGWTQACVDYVKSRDDELWHECRTADQKTAVHSECTTGAALGKYDTSCTLNVCLSNPECCNPANGWTQSCVNLASAKCKGGREGQLNSLGSFCGPLVVGPIGGVIGGTTGTLSP